MTSEIAPEEAYVWIWLPGRRTPVVAGRLAAAGEQLLFNYGRSYLARSDSISLYEPELPLRPGVLPPLAGLPMPGCIRDAAPDAWGRRVILSRLAGSKGPAAETAGLGELAYLLASGSDRSGALDFQSSATDYLARESGAASLEELLASADRVEQGLAINSALDDALYHGSSIGGARPKATITSKGKKYVAKFSLRSDVYNVVKAEFVAMRLADAVGVNAARVNLQRVGDKDVLLVERFDREKAAGGWSRRATVSALTMLALDEMMARYASYEDLAVIVRHRFTAPRETLKELFARMLFNVLCGNTDDHARNHAAFWDGRSLALTPAYDICPQARAGGEAGQAMLVVGNQRQSQIAACLRAAPSFQLSPHAAAAAAVRQITTIGHRWDSICDDAGLAAVDRQRLWRRQFLNPFAFEGAPEEISRLVS